MSGKFWVIQKGHFAYWLTGWEFFLDRSLDVGDVGFRLYEENEMDRAGSIGTD